MKFTIINQHLYNYGDEIAGITLIDSINKRFDNVDNISVYYKIPGQLNLSYDNVVHQGQPFTKSWKTLLSIFLVLIFSPFSQKIIFDLKLKQYISDIISSDYVFVSPCGANMGIYKDWKFMLVVLLCIRSGKKPIFHGITVGKSGNFLFDAIARYCFKNSEMFVREKKCVSFLNSMNIRSFRTVDTAFMFENEKPFRYDVKNYIVFIPTKLDSWHPNFKGFSVEEDISEKIIPALVSYAKRQDSKIVILPHMYNEEGGNTEVDLLSYYHDIIVSCGLNKSMVEIVNCEDFRDYDNFIKHSSFVVSMRYHGVVMSIKNCVPFLSLAYENKMTEVCNYSQKSDFNIELYNTKLPEFINIEYLMDRQNKLDRSIPDYLCFLAEQCIQQLFFRESNNR
ncbi:polysaccharide pyruvyl transferase family protein [Enterococcus hulanensis]|uniref:Polysaccharide pyruvyl transferase family protein n=1 Tax=Enterococcus hulanensis TaxID=2559929 RepID=A0ABU3F591_9ENTE|nr:polysaccharide pyruvyl transferase family protein [Enterococcus hulanensis]MDT2602293.1 polysaccharide pyruvyl transferase family protein [Enterococcus hulanensis]MDT2611688.1 polysaccharide pyruvyl transferase family protein [Enterococcus hulanensis]MDT2618914.1 polysaccharide pyruvyl transferase family protein [Enterococcus hulanensis]MDT2630365.1 polysaccharide pyruvyl transferase family protein [Enterococcus hulanensis]MDT2657851.1 polysaccharide pyruvyl transferase family protein [Ente